MPERKKRVVRWRPTTLICIEPGCGKPTYKIWHKKGSWYGRRCFFHFHLFTAKKAREAKPHKTKEHVSAVRRKAARIRWGKPWQ
jgi:hypothetical protein